MLTIRSISALFLPLVALWASLPASAQDGEPIVIVRVEPELGKAVSDTVVEIRGFGFPADPQVFFGDAEAQVLLAEVEGEIDRLLVTVSSRTDQHVDIRIVDRADPNRVGMSIANSGNGFEFVGEAILVPVLTGAVKSKSDAKAIVGAHIGVMPGSRSGIADLRGGYSLVLPGPGTFTVRAYASGFRSASSVVSVSQGQGIATLNLDLEPLAPGPQDSDGDGLADEDEKSLYGTDPLKPDTDSDGLGDGNEIAAGLDPLNFFDGDLLRRADTDFSGTVDARDLQFVINASLKSDPPENADLNRDDVVSAIDIQLAINVIIGSLAIQ